MNSLQQKIVSSADSVMDKMLYYSKKQVVKVEGATLYPSEAHMLIAAMEGMNFTEIACHFGITKGAVSQTMSRLVKKNVLLVKKDASAKNAAGIHLTHLGKSVFAQIQAKRSVLLPAVVSVIANFTPGEQQAISRFLTALENLIDTELIRREK